MKELFFISNYRNYFLISFDESLKHPSKNHLIFLSIEILNDFYKEQSFEFTVTFGTDITIIYKKSGNNRRTSRKTLDFLENEELQIKSIISTILNSY